MIPIYLKTIIKAEEEIKNLDDASYDERLTTIEKRQPHLNDYIDAALESFEDEEEFADKLIYYVLVVHNAFSQVKRFLPMISPDIIKSVEEEELEFFDKLDNSSDDEGEIAIDAKIANHPQRYLLRYLQTELNEDDEAETDDHIEELNIHIFWLLCAITSMYDRALDESGFDPKDGRDGLDKKEKKEWREKVKIQKKVLKTKSYLENEESFDTNKVKKDKKFDKPKVDKKNSSFGNIFDATKFEEKAKPIKKGSNNRDEYFKPKF